MTQQHPVSQAVRAARKALDEVDPQQPEQALPLLREAMDQLTTAMDESMAALVLDGPHTLRSVGTLAGLSENSVGPRLSRTSRLAAYSEPTGRVTAKGVQRAQYDQELGRSPEPKTETQPLRFKPRRPTSS